MRILSNNSLVFVVALFSVYQKLTQKELINMEQTAHLRASEAAAFLGVEKQTLWQWAKKGKIPAGIRISPRCTVWPKAELVEFLEQRRAAQQTQPTSLFKEGSC